MALPTPYIDAMTATVYLAGSEAWGAATTAERAEALSWGRVFLDATYVCQPFEETAPPDVIQIANAYAAEHYLLGELFITDETGGRELVSKTVRAGDVSVQKTYRGQFLQSAGDPYDRFPRITALLSGVCTLKTAAPPVQTVSLLRT